MAHILILELWRLGIEGEDDIGRAQCCADIDVLAHFTGNGEAVLIGHASRVNFPGLEGVNGGLGFHDAEACLLEFRLIAPPLLIWHEGEGPTLEVHVVYLEWAGAVLRVQFAQVGLVKLLWAINSGVEYFVKQTLPPRVGPIEGDDHVFVGSSLFHGGDALVAVGGVYLDVLVLAVVKTPGILKGLPIDGRAVVEGGVFVDLVGDDGVLALLVFLGLVDVVGVWGVVSLAVVKCQLGVVPTPYRAGIGDHIGMEGVLLLGQFADGEGEFTVVLELVAGFFVIVAGWIDLDVEAAYGLIRASARVGSTAGEREGCGGKGGYGSDPEASELVHNRVLLE